MGALYSIYTVKKVYEFPVSSRDVTTKLSLAGNNDVITELFLPRWSLVSDIPAGVTREPFFTVYLPSPLEFVAIGIPIVHIL